MTTECFLTRVDPSRNIARFYRLSIEPTLFGDFAVQRSWGRLGTWGQTRLSQFHDLDKALSHKDCLMNRKLQRGYTVDRQK
ncbi:MAG: WGR domain-containing protein [Roseibium sp.]